MSNSVDALDHRTGSPVRLTHADGLGGRVCLSTEGVNAASSTPDYVAKCMNGVAKIDVYAYDCTFTQVPNID